MYFTTWQLSGLHKYHTGQQTCIHITMIFETTGQHIATTVYTLHSIPSHPRKKLNKLTVAGLDNLTSNTSHSSSRRPTALLHCIPPLQSGVFWYWRRLFAQLLFATTLPFIRSSLDPSSSVNSLTPSRHSRHTCIFISPRALSYFIRQSRITRFSRCQGGPAVNWLHN